MSQWVTNITSRASCDAKNHTIKILKYFKPLRYMSHFLYFTTYNIPIKNSFRIWHALYSLIQGQYVPSQCLSGCQKSCKNSHCPDFRNGLVIWMIMTVLIMMMLIMMMLIIMVLIIMVIFNMISCSSSKFLWIKKNSVWFAFCAVVFFMNGADKWIVPRKTFTIFFYRDVEWQ